MFSFGTALFAVITSRSMTFKNCKSKRDLKRFLRFCRLLVTHTQTHTTQVCLMREVEK